MALKFKPLKIENPELFGISLSGSVGRGDRDRLKELADKCLANGRVNLVLDLSQLGSIGGGGARMIAELQERLTAARGGAVIAGAGDTVKRFLDQKFEGNPLTYFPDVAAAVDVLSGSAPARAAATATTLAEPEPNQAPAPVTAAAPVGDAASASSRRKRTAAEIGGRMDDLLDQFTVEQSRPGRRKDHHYTSLAEALAALDRWSERDGQLAFSEALKNLLFSQGLAEDVILLLVRGGLLVSPDGYKEIPLAGTLAVQAEQVARPMTMLDVREDNLSEEELSLLEVVNPDMILPVLCRGTLRLLLLIRKGGDGHEYGVAESFAFELLQQILERTVDNRFGPAAVEKAQAAAPVPVGKGGAAAEVMLQMALELPDAEDPPQFWRLFARLVQPLLEVRAMYFLAAGRPRPQSVVGGGEALAVQDFSESRLQKYFQAMELPVKTDNLPATFGTLKKALKAAGVNWVVGLGWQDEFLGTLFIGGEARAGGVISEDLQAVFGLAARLLMRCDDLNVNADLYLEIMQRVVGQREKRFLGTDDVTRAMVQQLNRLAREMGFAADQKRDLIFGCLLRDVGLIDKDDALMGSPADMTPAQWKSYRNHPSEGAALLGELDLSQTVLEVVKCHHERFNGEGFPAGLNGRDIPLAARVVTVVENFVAMTTGAGGLEPRTVTEAAAVLRENLGERYDPDIVAIFLSTVEPG